jgi:hypothetical protein
MYQHHSRDVIMKIIEDEGRPVYPREIHAKTAMGYPALRKLMRQMLKDRHHQQHRTGRDRSACRSRS